MNNESHPVNPSVELNRRARVGDTPSSDAARMLYL